MPNCCKSVGRESIISKEKIDWNILNGSIGPVADGVTLGQAMMKHFATRSIKLPQNVEKDKPISI